MTTPRKLTDADALLNRAQLAQTMRAAGCSYPRIAKQLGISLPRVEALLGEAQQLRADGYTYAEVGELTGVPRGSVRRLLPAPTVLALTSRDTEATHVAVHQYGMQVDVLARYLGIGMSRSYEVAARLFAAGLVYPLGQVQAEHGRGWVVPKPAVASRVLGWRAQDWTPPLGLAEHYRAVALVRPLLVGRDPHRWVSERVLRHHATGATDAHIHDGRFERNPNEWWALEVELTPKDPERLPRVLTAAVDTAINARCAGLLYLCRTSAVLRGVERAAAKLPDRPGFQLELADLDAEFLASHGIDDAPRGFKRPRTSAQTAKQANTFQMILGEMS